MTIPPREILDRAPPHDSLAEMSVNGAAILDPSALPAMIEAGYRAAVFHDGDNRQLAASILSAYSDHGTIDKTLILAALKPHEDALAGRNAMALLIRTIEATPTAANWPHHLGIVKEHWAKRQTFLIGQRMLTGSLNGEAAADIIAQVHKSLDEISATAGESAKGFGWMTSAELDAADDGDTYIVEGVWPAEQGGITSGRFKTLKTGVAVDLAMSASCGVDFLGRFRVPEPVRIGIMSAESGTKALQRRGRTVAASMGKELSECRNLVWSTASPRLARIDHLEALRKDIIANELRGVIIDPTYLAMCDIGADASNYIKMGAALNPITEIIRETGCSILLVNHNVKGKPKDPTRFDPPELGEISMAGFAEWARFWLLLGQRKEWNEETGEHWLWLRTGGSSGHAGLWHADVTEGPYISDGPKCDRGRKEWRVSVVSASEGNREETESKRTAKANAERQQLSDDKSAIVQAFGQYHDGESKRFVRDCLNWGDKRFNPPFAELLRERLLVETTFKKNGKGRAIDGYRIKRDSED